MKGIHMKWPPFLPNQILTFNLNSNVGIVCGWAQRDLFHERLQNVEVSSGGIKIPNIMNEIAAIGNLYSPSRGIDILVRNLLANPKIEYLIFTGPDLSGAMDAAMEMFLKPERIVTNEKEGYYSHENAPDLRIHIDIPIDVLSTLLWFIKAERAKSVAEIVHLLSKRQRSKISYDRNNSSEARKDLGSVLYPPPRIDPPTLPAPDNVHPIRAETIYKAYLELLYQIMTFGKQIDTHYDEPTRELMNLITIITDQNPDPEKIPEFIPFDMAHLKEYIPHLCENVKDPDVTYVYGNLIRGYFGVDQVKKVAQKLAKDESSRSAVISLVDQKWDKKHSPCLNHIWFRIAGGALHMTAVIRSNDMFFGWPENAYGLRKLQDNVRCLIIKLGDDHEAFMDDKSLVLGDLTIISQSAHIYERDWEPALEIVKKYHRPREWWDEKGQWMFEFAGDPEKVTAHLLEPDGPIVREFEGTAEEVMQRITDERLVSDVGHALWLGYTLGRGGEEVRNGNEEDRGFCLKDSEGSILIRFKDFDESQKWTSDRSNDDNDPIHGVGQVRIEVGIGDTGNCIIYDVAPSSKGIRARELLRRAMKDLKETGMKCTMKPLEKNLIYPIVLSPFIVDEILRERGDL